MLALVHCPTPEHTYLPGALLLSCHSPAAAVVALMNAVGPAPTLVLALTPMV